CGLSLALQGLIDFQVAAGSSIDLNIVAALFDLQPDKMRQRRALGVLEVIEQGSRRRNRRRQIGGTETGKVTGLELATQGLSGAVDVELPGCEPFATAADVIERGMGEVVRHQQFRRRDSLQLL